MNNSSEKDLLEIVKKESWLMRALYEVRELKLPDWYVGGGAIRNSVWNSLHGYNGGANQNDIDVVYFDDSDLEGTREKKYERELKSKNPTVIWEVVNQARTHLMNCERPKVKSTSESMAYWSETATCVGVRLDERDCLIVAAPHGLADLMNLHVKPVPKPYQDLELFRQRMNEKQWLKKWPRLKILVQ